MFTGIVEETGRVVAFARGAEAWLLEVAGCVVVASNGGQDQPPAWLFNIRAKADVGIQVGRTRSAGRARIVEADEPDYPRLWALMNTVNHGRYDGYQRLTTRPIALVVLTPV